MDRSKIEEEFKKQEFYGDYEGILTFAEHIAEIARNEALEEAVTACENLGVSMDSDWNRGLGLAEHYKDMADDCAFSIRALKII